MPKFYSRVSQFLFILAYACAGCGGGGPGEREIGRVETGAGTTIFVTPNTPPVGPSRVGNITGAVVDLTGAPLNNFELTGAWELNTQGSTLTRIGNRFTSTNQIVTDPRDLPDFPRFMDFSSPGFLTRRIGPLIVNEGQTTDLGNISLTPTGTPTGRIIVSVVDAQGRRALNYLITLGDCPVAPPSLAIVGRDTIQLAGRSPGSCTVTILTLDRRFTRSVIVTDGATTDMGVINIDAAPPRNAPVRK